MWCWMKKGNCKGSGRRCNPGSSGSCRFLDQMYKISIDEKADIVRPTGALYIQNLDGEKDAEGMVRSYFPSSRGFKSARYTLALYIDRENHKLVKSLLFDDEKDPYQMNNLSLEENQEVVKDLCAEMGKVLKEIDDPWYKEGILKDMIPY